MTDDPIQLGNREAAANWAAAGRAYERFSEDLGEATLHCIHRLAPAPGERVLDVAAGTGWGTRRVAARGARVHGVDFGDDLVAAARALAAEQGLEIEFSTAEAENLPFEEASFDLVMSTFGVMFATDPEAAAAELARVCRPGGRLGLATWSPDGTVAAMAREVMAPYRPPPPDPAPPSPFLWGDRARVSALLGAAFELRFEDGCTVVREPSGEAVWRMWSQAHGPTVALLRTLSPERGAAFERDFVAFHERYRGALGIAMPRDYLVTIGVRK